MRSIAGSQVTISEKGLPVLDLGGEEPLLEALVLLADRLLLERLCWREAAGRGPPDRLADSRCRWSG
jgi:hypothetical protein